MMPSDFAEKRELLEAIIRDSNNTRARYSAMESLKGLDWESIAYCDQSRYIRKKAVKKLNLGALEKFINETDDAGLRVIAQAHYEAVLRMRQIHMLRSAALHPVQLGGYQWLVLGHQDKMTLLISDGIIEQRAYHDCGGSTTWEECSIREYLNREFYDNLDAGVRAKIKKSRLENKDNPWGGKKGGGGKATTDKVFLLSTEEVVQYFGDSKQYRDTPGEVIKKMKKMHYAGPDAATMYFDDLYSQMSGSRIDDCFNFARIANHETKASWWWLRTPGNFNYRAAYVDDNGTVIMAGREVNREDGGLRPAMWVELET